MTAVLPGLYCRAVVWICLFAAMLHGQSPRAGGAIDPSFIQQTVHTLASTVEKEYVDPGAGTRIASALRDRLGNGAYSDSRTLDSLAEALTRDLFAWSRDKHLAVSVIRPRRPAPTPVAAPTESREARARRLNYGFQRVEILPGNIGYLNLTQFERVDDTARETVAAAMAMLRHADALIVDMRTNGGGSPDGAALVASYFFDQPDLPLFAIASRSGVSQKEYRTEAGKLAGRNGTRPMYVLTAFVTFSAGEGLAYLLQERRRAEVIGERTAGAANPGRPYALNSNLEVTVPNGKVISAVKRSNWEGTGVEPDVPVPAEQALEAALTRARAAAR